MSVDLQSVASDKKLQLETVLPDWCALTWQHLVVCAFFCFGFVLFSYLPVAGQATWSDVCAGKYSTIGGIESVLPLSDGIRNQAIGLCGKRIVSNVFGFWGANGLSVVFALLQLVSLVLWGLVFVRLRAGWPAFAGIAWIFLACFFRFDGLNTLLFGQICTAALMLMLIVPVARGPSNSYSWTEGKSVQWVMVFLLFVLWVNLDSTFVLGLMLLASSVGSRFFEIKRNVKLSDLRFLKDSEFQNRIWLLEWAVVATFFNPDGMSFWVSIFWWPDNPLLHSIQSGDFAYMFSWTGMVVAIGWLFVFLSYRKSNELSIFLLVASVIMTLLVAFSPKMVFWFASTIAMVCLHSIGQARIPDQTNGESTTDHRSLRFVFTLACGLLIWLAFCLTPVGNVLLGGKSRTESQIVGTHFPIAARQFLNENKHQGLYVSPTYWGNWIQSSAPIPLMCTSDLNKLPPIVLRDCEAIYQGVSDWRKIADKYALAGIIVDKQHSRKLIRHLRRQPGEWNIAFEDELSIIFRREL